MRGATSKMWPPWGAKVSGTSSPAARSTSSPAAVAATRPSSTSPGTSLAGLANLAVCPTSAASTPINDHVFQLEVSIDAGDGVARPMVALDVMPRCAVDDTYCACDCDPTGAACAAAR